MIPPGHAEACRTYVLEARGLRKSFFGVPALKGVDFGVCPGEIHALVGQNGSGKSTLCRILTGLYSRDAGEVLVEGRRVEITSPRAAAAQGIAMIPQEPSLVPQMTAPENVFLGRERAFAAAGLVSRRAMARRTEELMDDLGFGCDLRVPVGQLSVATQEMIAICRALAWGARVLIFDEPTASLSRTECATLFATMRQLCGRGAGIVFISHRLEEVFELADRATVLGDGEVEGVLERPERSAPQLLALLLGRPVIDDAPAGAAGTGTPAAAVHVTRHTRRPAPAAGAAAEALAVEGLCVDGRLFDVGLRLAFGEILGLTGQVGAGKTELAECLAGLRRYSRGRVLVKGTEVHFRSPRDAVASGLCLLPEDRRQALVPLMPTTDNVLLADLGSVAHLGVVDRGRRWGIVKGLSERLHIGTDAQLRAPVRRLSGGNQQKVVIGRWIQRESRILIFDEPTRGVDVEAKAAVHRFIRGLADEGRAVLLISSELPEVLALSDRILILKDGRLSGEFSAVTADERALLERVL